MWWGNIVQGVAMRRTAMPEDVERRFSGSKRGVFGLGLIDLELSPTRRLDQRPSQRVGLGPCAAIGSNDMHGMYHQQTQNLASCQGLRLANGPRNTGAVPGSLPRMAGAVYVVVSPCHGMVRPRFRQRSAAVEGLARAGFDQADAQATCLLPGY